MNRHLLKRLRADQAGSPAIELALLAPLLCVMVFSAVDLANGFAMKLALEQAAGRAAELATAPGTVATSYANLRDEVIAAYGGTVLSANVDNWMECGGVRQLSYSTICAANTQMARYVSIQISAEYLPYFNYGGLLTGGGINGGFVTQGDAVVRIQ